MLLLTISFASAAPQTPAAVMAKDGKAQMPITISAEASDEIKALATTLAQKLGKISGVTFQVATNTSPKGIALGTITEFPSVKSTLSATDVSQAEDYIIRTHAGGVYLIGATDKGVGTCLQVRLQDRSQSPGSLDGGDSKVDWSQHGGAGILLSGSRLARHPGPNRSDGNRLGDCRRGTQDGQRFCKRVGEISIPHAARPLNELDQLDLRHGRHKVGRSQGSRNCHEKMDPLFGTLPNLGWYGSLFRWQEKLCRGCLPRLPSNRQCNRGTHACQRREQTLYPRRNQAQVAWDALTRTRK